MCCQRCAHSCSCSNDPLGKGESQLYCSGTHYICCIYSGILHHCRQNDTGVCKEKCTVQITLRQWPLCCNTFVLCSLYFSSFCKNVFFIFPVLIRFTGTVFGLIVYIFYELKNAIKVKNMLN